MRDAENAPGSRIRGWGALLVVAAFAHAPGALAQIYKCTAADGKTSFSDKPCATSPGAAGGAAAGKAGTKQEVLRQQAPPATGISTDATSAMCARYEGSKTPDSLIQSLPEKQRETVIAALRGVIMGMSRDSGAQENLKRVTLHIDAARNAVICVPQQRAQAPGAPPITTYTSHRIEPNGRMETQQAGAQPGAPPLVANDANEPATLLARCASLVTSCIRPQAAASAIDGCFEKAPACPAGRLDPALSCCPQACKDGFSRERSRGTDSEKAMLKVLFGDDGGTSCVPGIPKRG